MGFAVFAPSASTRKPLKLKYIYEIISKNWKTINYLIPKEASIKTVDGMLRGRQIYLVGILRTGTGAQVNDFFKDGMFFIMFYI